MPGDRNYEVKGPIEERFDEILTPDALDFVADLHRRFNATRKELLAAASSVRQRFDAGEQPDFLPETKHIRDDASLAGRARSPPPTCRTVASRSPARPTGAW